MESTIENQIDNIINYNSNQITYNHLFTLNSIVTLSKNSEKDCNRALN